MTQVKGRCVVNIALTGCRPISKICSKIEKIIATAIQINVSDTAKCILMHQYAHLSMIERTSHQLKADETKTVRPILTDSCSNNSRIIPSTNTKLAKSSSLSTDKTSRLARYRLRCCW